MARFSYLFSIRAGGQAVSALWASQSAIYQRYGYAEAHTTLNYSIDTVEIGFADGDGGSCVVKQSVLGAGAALPAALETMYIACRAAHSDHTLLKATV